MVLSFKPCLGVFGTQHFPRLTTIPWFAPLTMCSSQQSCYFSISHERPVDEESLPAYKTDRYYPARIGQVLDGKLQIIGKLGYGMSSTVWLCKDLRHHKYCAVKICTRDTSRSILLGERREVQVVEQLNALHSDHPGRAGLRTLDDTLSLQGEDGEIYKCLLHRPLGTSLWELQSVLGGILPLQLCKGIIVQVLLALDYLHREATIVHTDLQARNIMLDLKDNTPLTEYEKAEKNSPSAFKIDGNHVIYETRHLRPSISTLGFPMLIDFGEARDGGTKHRDEIMPDVYRAPEVILDTPWDFKVDIWNLGVLIWTLLEGESLFIGLDSEGDLNNYYHLAEMVALLGPAPASFIMTGDLGPKYFNADGTWKEAIEVPNISLEMKEKQFQGEEKAEFLRFLRRMLQWDPAQRATAKELIYDDFLAAQYRR